MEMLSTAWYLVIGFCVIMYVLLDGFDLGIGLLFPFVNDDEKHLMMKSILPVWDGNQTWLILGTACLYGAFPRAFSLLLPALYLPLLFMALGLLLRGITFEFCLKEKKDNRLWNYLFFTSSVTVTFIQGILVGVFVKGFESDQQGHLLFTLLTPFNLSCGLALLFGYSLLGSTWTIAKTTGHLQNKMFTLAFNCLCVVAFFLCFISFWSSFVDNHIWQRWFNPNNVSKVIFLPCITAALVVYLAYCMRKRYEYILYWLSIAIFLCTYIGLGISTWPHLIPHHMTMWEVAAPPSSQIFMLVGTLLILPILIAYTFYAYYIFRNKVNEQIEY
jgi:cytochrome bd ubiquinol oxidase subunit II